MNKRKPSTSGTASPSSTRAASSRSDRRRRSTKSLRAGSWRRSSDGRACLRGPGRPAEACASRREGSGELVAARASRKTRRLTSWCGPRECGCPPRLHRILSPEKSLGGGMRDAWRALWASLWISLATVALSAALGIPLAFLFERADFPGRRALGTLIALPVVLPPLVGVVAFLFLYGGSGCFARAVQSLSGSKEPPWRLSGPGAILFVHAYSMYVYFYLFA